MLPRVAIVAPTFPPYQSGMGNVVAAQARLLAAGGFSVTVHAPIGATVEQIDGFCVERPQVLARYGNAAWCPQLVAETAEADAVFLHYPFFGGIESFALHRKRPGQRLVVYYHMDPVGQGVLQWIFWAHRKFFLKRLLVEADAMLVSSYDYAHTSRALRPYLPLLKGKLHEVPLAVDGRKFTPGEKPPALLEKYGMEGTTPVVLFVGALDRAHYFKGVPVLLDAWQRFTKQLPEARLLIIGAGDRRAAYESSAASLGLTSSVRFLGGVAAAALPDHYRLADIVVLPSIDRSEAFGLVLLEAMACGRATIASRLPGVASVVRMGETGYLVPPGDSSALAAALERLLRQPAVPVAMGREGRRVVQQEYSYDRLTERLRQVFSRPR